MAVLTYRRCVEIPADGPKLLADLGGVRFGVFRCPPDSPRWSTTNCIGAGVHVVFPRRPVRIRQHGASEFVTDANHVVVYLPEQEYSRRPAGPGGDLCHYLAWEPGLAVPGCPVAGQAALPAVLFLQQRRLMADVLRCGDRLELEERALALVGAVLGIEARPRRPATRLVDATKELLANRYAEDLRLADLAGSLHISPYHLARVFRAATGQSLHGYRTQLRLRAAVDLMAAGPDRLADIALDCGFASHSHLSDAFRRRFGSPPGAVRASLAA